MGESKDEGGHRISSRGLRSGVARRRRDIACASLGSLVAAAIVACAPKVAIETSVVQPAADFAALRSFSIILSENQAGNVDHAIAEEIRRDLVGKGLASVEPDTADMLIAYRASAVDLTKSVLDSDPDANFYRIVEYVEGTLVIDVFSRADTRRIWHGQAVLDDRDRDELLKRKVNAVADVLADFPPGG